ncbi:MAG: 23S rRNA (adenine(2503)-C(2))-methyltransferase RlmN [Bacilli bacterium]|nr:23S rRNA (adenine(2503)-C(2))-methyltransferase RlmN [Bacilli bacterium]
MNNIYNLTKNDLEQYFIDNGYPKFRATQIYEWIYKKRITNFDAINNIKTEIIEKLKQDFYFDIIEIVKQEKGTYVIKYLFNLKDKNQIEAVLMLHDYGNSLCISTQVGCNMGCLFCASGKLKKIRNLEVNEMVSQILVIEKENKLRVSHVVLMGIGEPFDNYDNVLKFIKIINDNKGIDIGARHITISTCGLIPQIEQFRQEKLQVNLAISLHASSDELRTKLMPINKVYKIKDLITVIHKYVKQTKRRVTFEYIMLDEINDHKEDAISLAHLLKDINCYVNLIPYNETNNPKYKKSKRVKIKQFYDILKKYNINVTIRKEFGGNIAAACGQLRATSLRR